MHYQKKKKLRRLNPGFCCGEIVKNAYSLPMSIGALRLIFVHLHFWSLSSSNSAAISRY